jgi:hypothetical protein
MRVIAVAVAVATADGVPDALGRGQRQAGVYLVLGGIAHQIVEETADLAHVAGSLRQAFLVGVELLEHHHG